MTLQRRTPLAPGKPLARGKGLAPGRGIARSSKPIPQQSQQRRSEKDERAEVVRLAISAEGGRCALWWLGGCRGVLVGHEVAHRSVYKGSHLIQQLVVALCVGHNHWEDIQTNDVAWRAGVRCPASAVDMHGLDAVEAELRRIRLERSYGRDPGLAFWH